MTRIITSVCVFVVLMFVWWYSGADLLHRNPENAFALFVCTGAVLLVYSCPLWKDGAK